MSNTEFHQDKKKKEKQNKTNPLRSLREFLRDVENPDEARSLNP